MIHSPFRMNTLFLDLASHQQSVALVRDAKTVASIKVDSKVGEGQLLPLIEGMLSKENITFKDLDRIASTTGPGGFMSLRVGIALANALSDSLQIPLAGVHLSDLWHARANSNLWIHSTKKEFVFVRGFGEGAASWQEPTLEHIKDLQDMITHDTQYTGELIESQQAVLPRLKKAEQLGSFEEVLPELLATLTFEQKSLEPWYGRGA